MPDEPQNPIVAAAMRIRAKRELAGAIDVGAANAPYPNDDAESALRAFAGQLAAGIKRVNAILAADPVKLVVLERPLRLRLRFREHRLKLDLDDPHQLVRVVGLGLEGEYQFDPAAGQPALVNLSKISTESGYGEALTAALLLRRLTQDAELPRPPHLDDPGPLRF
ncbi:MAG: hypothetical protein JOZ38_10335 [Candidatus Eremiobacteraeota bacterium]|nr:hypothetical protein [Candidatus Eremiobacteraeota bacterium]